MKVVLHSPLTRQECRGRLKEALESHWGFFKKGPADGEPYGRVRHDRFWVRLSLEPERPGLLLGSLRQNEHLLGPLRGWLVDVPGGGTHIQLESKRVRWQRLQLAIARIFVVLWLPYGVWWLAQAPTLFGRGAWLGWALIAGGIFILSIVVRPAVDERLTREATRRDELMVALVEMICEAEALDGQR